MPVVPATLPIADLPLPLPPAICCQMGRFTCGLLPPPCRYLPYMPAGAMVVVDGAVTLLPMPPAHAARCRSAVVLLVFTPYGGGCPTCLVLLPATTTTGGADLPACR